MLHVYALVSVLVCTFISVGSNNLEETFPHHNWILVVSIQILVTSSWTIKIPSIYQFVTTPRSLPEGLDNEEVKCFSLHVYFTIIIIPNY